MRSRCRTVQSTGAVPMMRRREVWFTGRGLLGLLLTVALPVWLGGPAVALDSDEADRIPHLNNRGKEAFGHYLLAGDHRAFAVAPGGGWSWVSGASSRTEAESGALRDCRSVSRGACALYAVDDEVVFDRDRWASLWGPYLNPESARDAASGTAVGNRFPDLTFSTEAGVANRLSNFRGKVVVVHFWGSWCGVCRRELPDLQQLYRALPDAGEVELVMLQVRESFRQSRDWVMQAGLELPLCDSGVSGENDTLLSLAGGTRVEDRLIAHLFPSTFVLDGNGIVVYARAGAALGWVDYLPLLRHVARQTAVAAAPPSDSPAGDG